MDVDNESESEEKMNKILYQDGEFSYQDREKVCLLYTSRCV